MISRIFRGILANPFATVILPPILFLLHFATVLAMLKLGFPDEWSHRNHKISLLLIVLFGVALLTFPGMALGVRQAFLLKPRFLPLIGVALNALYFVGFFLFFLFVFVLQSIT